ncbi:MAG TPA: molybdopterin-dependent oxidoreductase [Pseudonocardiaceae bacterium]|jgi:DMSO/TMAO reductase YedYZ molybdopterin-dependent catalytic subunit|nr:molybdopterin-dependent oxidoreductase [Pseudonocardiaceae bacterium]
MRDVSTRYDTEQTNTPRIPLFPAAALGVVSIGAALAGGQLVAGFVGNDASPYLAVGDVVVDHVPAWLKEFAVQNFGTNDKMVLLGTMGVVLLLLGALAGVLSRRSPTPGSVLAVLLGVAGVAAVLGRGDVGQLAVLAPVVSLVVGVLSFRLLQRLALEWTEARELRPVAGDHPVYGDPAGESRRKFLVGTLGVAVGAGAAGVVGEVLTTQHDAEGSREAIGRLVPVRRAPVPTGADFARNGTPTFITDAASFYRIDTALAVPQLRAEDWALRIHGMVDREMTLHYQDIHRRPLVERIVTLCCVSNEVGGPYISTARFEGVLLKDLLAEVGVHPDADQLLSTSIDGYSAGTPIDTLTDDRGAMLAIGMNGEPLPVEHGFPARMVVPGLYGYVSATKWVVDMRLTTFADAQGYWVPRGYSQQAPVKTESRIDVPGSFATVDAGSVVIAGIAWAQTKGVKKVEVRVDNGPWHDAQLTTEVTKNAWRMWRIFLPLRAGQHTVQARATDDSGYTQTADLADPIPNGASGYPSVTFNVR